MVSTRAGCPDAAQTEDDGAGYLRRCRPLAVMKGTRDVSDLLQTIRWVAGRRDPVLLGWTVSPLLPEGLPGRARARGRHAVVPSRDPRFRRLRGPRRGATAWRRRCPGPVRVHRLRDRTRWRCSISSTPATTRHSEERIARTRPSCTPPARTSSTGRRTRPTRSCSPRLIATSATTGVTHSSTGIPHGPNSGCSWQPDARRTVEPSGMYRARDVSEPSALGGPRPHVGPGPVLHA